MEKRPVVLMILDGYGLNDNCEANAVCEGKTPIMDQLMSQCPFVKGQASGLAVGLPDGQMGNSEVGHLNMGAGRIVYQELTRITKSIEDGDFFSNEALMAAVENCKKNDSALHMFGLVSDGGVPVDKIAKGNPEYALRQKGKVATLALGYQGGTSALIAMGALQMGLTEEELPDIVQRWRQANPRIRDLWYAVENAALAVMQTAQPQAIYGLIFALEGDLVYGQSFLTVQLPSGRKLYYPKPFLKENQFGKLALHYYTVGQQTRKWEVASTYGGKMTENIVQAVARDCLAVTLERIAAKHLQVVFHVHDEVIIDAPMETTVDEICGLMAEPIPWAPGLILKGAGFESNYYMKD